MLVKLAVGLLATIAVAQPVVDYERQVHPLLAAKCFVCHSQEKRSGGFSLATYGDLLEGGRSGAARVSRWSAEQSGSRYCSRA